jgi:hypothetical protein
MLIIYPIEISDQRYMHQIGETIQDHTWQSFYTNTPVRLRGCLFEIIIYAEYII